jgi:hypothetical protein
MAPRPFRSRLLLPALACLLAVAAAPAFAQMGGGAGGGGGGQGGGGQGGGGQGGAQGGGGALASAAGVVIDANGVLRSQMVTDAGLSLERRKAAVAALPGDLQRKSTLRKVALSRLEAEVQRAAASGRGIPDDLLKLAGLTKVQYVFIYPAVDVGDAPAAGEVVIAGPAEPWMADATGRVVGTATGAATFWGSATNNRLFTSCATTGALPGIVMVDDADSFAIVGIKVKTAANVAQAAVVKLTVFFE